MILGTITTKSCSLMNAIASSRCPTCVLSSENVAMSQLVPGGRYGIPLCAVTQMRSSENTELNSTKKH